MDTDNVVFDPSSGTTQLQVIFCDGQRFVPNSTVLEVKVNHFDGSMNAMHKKTGINRQTLMKFEKDVDGRYHVMRVEGDKWQLLTAVGRG